MFVHKVPPIGLKSKGSQEGRAGDAIGQASMCANPGLQCLPFPVELHFNLNMLEKIPEARPVNREHLLLWILVLK